MERRSSEVNDANRDLSLNISRRVHGLLISRETQIDLIRASRTFKVPTLLAHGLDEKLKHASHISDLIIYSNQTNRQEFKFKTEPPKKDFSFKYNRNVNLYLSASGFPNQSGRLVLSLSQIGRNSPIYSKFEAIVSREGIERSEPVHSYATTEQLEVFDLLLKKLIPY